MTYFSLPLLYSRALRLALLFVAFFAATQVFSQTILNRGDFAILAVNANLPTPNNSRDEISFVCFKDITTGTEIQVTDNGYSSCVTGLWSSGEGGAVLRRTGGVIPKGTVITFRTTTPYVFISPDNGWTVTDLSPTQLSSNLNMNSTTGDQIYFAQGGTWTELASMCNIGTAAAGANSRIGPNASFPGNSGRILFGFSTSGEWVPGTSLGALDGKSGNSGLYPGMQCFSMAPTGGQAYNKYFGPLTATTQTEWIKRISDVNNWKIYNQSNYPTADYNFIGMTIPISDGGDIPTATWVAPSLPLCATSSSLNLNTLITTGATGGTWSGTGVSGNTFNPNGLNGSYDITYSINYVTSSGSCPISQTNTITVSSIAAPVLSVTQPTCLVSTGSISVNPVSGIIYSIDGTNFSSSTTFNNLIPNTYTITAKNTNGCTAATTVTVNTSPSAPSAPVISVTQPTCTVSTGSISVPSVPGITYSIDGINFSASTTFSSLTPSTYTITAKNAGGCISSANATINAAPLVPSVLTITTVDPTCVASGSITVTSPVGAGFTYSIDGTNFQANPAFTSGISAGNYTVTVKNSSGCINTGTTTINAVPSAPAAALFAVTQPTCTIATGSIAVTTVSGITYSIDGTNFSATPSFINLVPNTYTITAKNASGCITTATAVVNAQPTTPSAPTLAVVDNCGNSTITASGVTGTLTWSDAGTGNPRTVTTAASYTVTQTLNGCTSAASNSVTSAPKTIPSAPTLAVVDNCGNSTITASGVTGTIIWSDAGTGNPRTVTTAASYTVTQTLNGCTSAVSNSVTSVPKTIPSAPTLTVVDNCGNSIITTSSVTGTLIWSDAGTGNPRTVTNAATYSVTQTVGGCTSVASNSVTSAPKTIPSAPTLAVVDNCSNSTITASGVTGTLTWSDAGTGNPRTVTTAASYTVTQTLNGCTSVASNSVTSAPKTIPSAPTLAIIDNCGNSTITASGVTGTLTWSDAGTGNPRTVTTAASYTVTQTLNGCTSAASNSVTSAPKTIPSAPTVTTPVTYCQNAIATALTATGTNLLWYGTIATGGTASGTAPTPVTTAGGSANYYVSQTVGSCESPRAAINVIVIATPAPTVVSPITFCQNATAAALSATGTNLLWYGTNATGGTSSSTAPIPLTTTVGTTNYYVSQTVSGCESPRATIAVSIEAFTIGLSANPNPAFGGVAFTGQITANLPIASSIWQPSNLFVNNLSTQTIIAPDTSFTLVVTGVSANGCRSTASRLVTVVPSNNTIFIPNALTTAAVGTDASVIKVYGTTVKTAQLLVYNQWGQLIFQTDSATTKGWDGTFNGKAQPSGVYTYVVRVVYQNNKVETKSGAINLIR